MILNLNVDDPEVVADLELFIDPDERATRALQAMRIGIMALRTARGEVDARALQARLDAALTALSTMLREHATLTLRGLTDELEGYFRPNSGMMPLHLDRFKADAAQLLNAMIEEGSRQFNSVVELNVGHNSALMKLISPEYSTAIIHTIEQRNQQLLNELVKNVQEHVIGQFSIDQPNTALNRLKTIVQTSQLEVVRAFDLNDPGSALARINRELGERLVKMATEQASFREEVRGILLRLEARQEERAQTTSHGLIYEDEVGSALSRLARAGGHVCEATGMTTGVIRNCKVGDFMLTLSDDCAGAGARVVVEAKSAGGYTLTKILEEAKVARDNRQAQLTIFVIDPQYADAAWPALARHGETVVLKWAPGDELHLSAAWSVALALAVRNAQANNGHKTINADELERAALEVQKRTQSLEEIMTWTETITKASEKILDRVRVARKALQTQTELILDEISNLKASAS